MYKSLEVPLHLLGAVTSRIKIMASLDISERRLPQDGRVHVLLDGRKIDLRVSTFPRQSRREDRDPRARYPQRLAESAKTWASPKTF